MPRPHPPEFRQRAVELARMREKPIVELARDLGISESCLRNWVAQADRDEGRRADGLSTAERDELVRLRRELRVAKLEVEILKRAAAYFATENVLPK
jgi:transposase